MTPAEKQKRYRQIFELNPERFAEVKKKHRERYHTNKELVKDMTEREHRSVKHKWRIASKRRKDHQLAVHVRNLETLSSTSWSGD